MSTLLSEEDLNDFISPALECTKPTTINAEPSGVDENGEVVVVKEQEAAQKVSITLSDCLACSGCITSSEEIMLQRQSHTVFLDAMRDDQTPEKRLCVSISPQSRVSMSMYYGMSIEQFDLCLINFFKQHFNAKYVVGIQIGRNVSIQRTIEYVTRWKSTREAQGDMRPRLSAMCPGFVIYTEKTKGELVPLLINVKSPQQITGNLLKREDPGMYHLSIMACFDKKLEASRPDSEGEVDCVITPKEFLSMLEELNVDFRSFATDHVSLYQEVSPVGWDPRVHWSTNTGSSSGGWAYQYVVAMQNLNPNSKLLELPGKNTNIKEYRLVDPQTHETIASATELSGFRNIQNLVRNLSTNNKHPKRRVQVLRKRGVNACKNHDKTMASNGEDSRGTENGGISGIGGNRKTMVAEPYKTDFIEVNASPGGCINGGGLINNETGKTQRKNLTDAVEQTYFSALPMVDPLTSTGGIEGTFEYEFHAVEASNDLVSVGNKW